MPRCATLGLHNDAEEGERVEDRTERGLHARAPIERVWQVVTDPDNKLAGLVAVLEPAPR